LDKYIEFKDVRKVYKMGEVEIEALSGVDFSIDKGEFVIVAGASGAGKSTLLRCLNLLEKPTEGSIFVDKEDITTLSDKEVRKNASRSG